MPEPLRVAIVNDYEIVVAGIAAVLEPFAGRVEVVELDSGMPVVDDVDVVLYDTFGQTQGDGVDLRDLVAGDGAKVVIYTWNTQPELVDRALARGAAGYLSKRLGGEDLVRALEDVAAGTQVRPAARPTTPGDVEVAARNGDWPGSEHGLSAREAEIIALISQGLSNQDIAERTYLSINSVKTYIRSGYRKIGVSTRSQAVIWGLGHGFRPDRSRNPDPH